MHGLPGRGGADITRLGWHQWERAELRLADEIWDRSPTGSGFPRRVSGSAPGAGAGGGRRLVRPFTSVRPSVRPAALPCPSGVIIRHETCGRMLLPTHFCCTMQVISHRATPLDSAASSVLYFVYQ